jgi:hypothetical protein
VYAVISVAGRFEHLTVKEPEHATERANSSRVNTLDLPPRGSAASPWLKTLLGITLATEYVGSATPIHLPASKFGHFARL